MNDILTNVGVPILTALLAFVGAVWKNNLDLKKKEKELETRIKEIEVRTKEDLRKREEEMKQDYLKNLMNPLDMKDQVEGLTEGLAAIEGLVNEIQKVERLGNKFSKK